MNLFSRRDFLGAAAAAASASLLPHSAAAAPAPRRNFQLGLVSYNVSKDWDLPTTLKVCKEAGIAALECRTTHKHGVEPTLSPSQRKDVKKQFADSGVVFWGCGSTCEFQAVDPAVVKKNIEDCKRFIDLVKDLGGKGVKVRPNGVPKGADLQKTLEQIGRALVECGKAAADAGVEIFVEVHGAVTQVPQNMRTIMDACGHPAVGACWNSNAADLDANKSVAASFALLKPFLRSCHINDLENDRKGAYPYRELFKLLRESGYDRYTLIEYGKSFDVAAGTEFLKNYRKRWEELAND